MFSKTFLVLININLSDVGTELQIFTQLSIEFVNLIVYIGGILYSVYQATNRGIRHVNWMTNKIQ
jgi:hypothetical protein